MNNLVRYDNDGLELIIDESTGEVFASISGYARMAGKSQPAISKRIAHNQIVLKSAEVQTTTGFKTHNLVDENLMYEWLAKDNPELLVQCAKAGLRLYLHGLAGYKYEIKKVEPEKPVLKQHTVVEYVEAQEKIENINNATLQELLRDMLVEELSVVRTNKSLPSSKPNEYTTLKVRAKELGYTEKQIGSGSALGKYMAKQIEPEFSERVGKYAVNHYLINEQLDSQIHTYFAMKQCLS